MTAPVQFQHTTDPWLLALAARIAAVKAQPYAVQPNPETRPAWEGAGK